MESKFAFSISIKTKHLDNDVGSNGTKKTKKYKPRIKHNTTIGIIHTVSEEEVIIRIGMSDVYLKGDDFFRANYAKSLYYKDSKSNTGFTKRIYTKHMDIKSNNAFTGKVGSKVLGYIEDDVFKGIKYIK